MKSKGKVEQISPKMPTFLTLMKPLIKALKLLGGSGTIQEIYEKVVEILKLPDEILEVPHGDLTQFENEVDYRLAWSRTYLKKYGILENSTRGVWALLPSAKDIDEVDPQDVLKTVKRADQAQKEQKKHLSSLSGDVDEINSDEEEQPEEFKDWRKNLRRILVSMKPAAFERLAQRLLRESGFTQVEVTGKSGDGGIDGKGIVRLNGFLSFHVMFQCKKYDGSVSSNQVRDFRGAMQGRADKGLLITTGTFTRDAMKEATRDGAPPIDLIDGEQLVDKLKELSLGVKTIVVEEVEIDQEWFERI
jgi:restriction system protein